MPSNSDDKNAVNMDRRCSNASDTSLEDGGATRKLSLPDGSEFIPTRCTKVTPPKPAANPLQFIKVGPCDLYKSAQEQIKRVEEVKRIKETVKEEAEDWQSNLDNWKCSRRKRQEHIIERVVEVKKLELEEHDRNRRRSKTFSEMMEERNSRGRKTSLMVYKDDEANDLSDLGIGTSSGDDNHSLSDRDERPGHGSNDDNQSLSDRDEQHTNGNHKDTSYEASNNYPEEYTYDRAIQNYVNFTESRVKAKNNINEDTKPAEILTNGHKDSSKKSPPKVATKPTRDAISTKDDKLSFLEERRKSSTDLSTADKVKLAKVDVLKRRELFENGEKEVKSPSKVLVNNSQSIKDRLSILEKQGEQNGTKTVNRLSGEITGSIKDRLTSLERQKSTEKLNGKDELLRKRLSNGDLSPTQSVKDRLSSLERQGSTEECKETTHASQVSIKERLSNLDSAINKDVKKVTPDRDPTFSTKLANFQNEEIPLETKLSAGSERSSSPEDEIYATQRHSFHRSLDSLDVEADLGNDTFERVQSLEELDCIGRRDYPPSTSSVEMLVFSSQSGDTDREDSGIHTADVSSSVSQADEPVEDITTIHIETNDDNFLDIEVVSHRRQISDLSDQLSPLPPIQEIEMFESTTTFLHVEDTSETTQSDDVSQSTSHSITLGGGESNPVLIPCSDQSLKDIPFHKKPSSFFLVDIDIDEASVIAPPAQAIELLHKSLDVKYDNLLPVSKPTDNPPYLSKAKVPVTDIPANINATGNIGGVTEHQINESETLCSELNETGNFPTPEVKNQTSILPQTTYLNLGSQVDSPSEKGNSNLDSKAISVISSINPGLPLIKGKNLEPLDQPALIPNPVIESVSLVDHVPNSSVKNTNLKSEPLNMKPHDGKPITVSGVLKLELSLESLVKDNAPQPSVNVPVDLPVDIQNNPSACGNSGDGNTKPLPMVVSLCRKVFSRGFKSPSPDSVSKKIDNGYVEKVLEAPMSTAEKRRTVVEICEKVDVATLEGDSKSPPTTPFFLVHESNKGDSTKEPLEAVIAPRESVPDKMLLAARETVSMPQKEEASLHQSAISEPIKKYEVSQEIHLRVNRKVDEGLSEPVSVPVEEENVEIEDDMAVMSSISTLTGYNTGLFNPTNGEEIIVPLSTDEILPLNLNGSDVELLSGGLDFPLGPTSAVEPPKEKPPPPPTESDDEVPKMKTSLRRVDSTKRIKKELRRKRSDFLGIEGNTDEDSYLEPVLSVAPPDMTAFLIEEQRHEKQLYRQSICSESDSNPGESRDSGVELDRPQVLTPDQSADHSRQESEIYGNASITSEEDEITKKEREIIEILEKEEQWRYANNPSEEDLGEKLAEKLRQLEQEKLRLEWERAEEENRRITEENLRREEKMRLRAKEQELRQQETPVTSTGNGNDGDGNNIVEAIRAERERLQQEQEELINQRENLIMRETQQLQRNTQPWDHLPSSAMSLQDISLQATTYQQPPAVPPAPLNYRLSLPDLQEQPRTKNHRPPPPIPPAKPLRSVSQEQNPNHPQQMTRQTLQALSAAPRSRIVSTDTWIQAKKKPENQRNSGQGNNYNYQHWLIQEAEHRRITEQQQRNAAPVSPRKSSPVSQQQWTQPQQREKPLPDAIIQTLTQRVQNRAGFNENKNSPQRRELQIQMSQKPMQGSPVNNSPVNNKKNGPPLHNGHNGHNSHSTILNNGSPVHNSHNGPLHNSGHNSPILNNGHNGPILNNGHNGPIISNGPIVHNGTMMNHGPMNISPMTHSPLNSPTSNGDSQEKMLSVSGKKKCSHCGEELGRGAAMIIESLRLFYHIDCFKCCVCHVQLGDGLMGTDVRVRNNKLHCHNCYSSDDGVKFSCV